MSSEDDNDVAGPIKLDTEEQYRTRERSPVKEREADSTIRTDPERSTLQQNVDARGGVDDRGAEEGPSTRGQRKVEAISWPRTWSSNSTKKS